MTNEEKVKKYLDKVIWAPIDHIAKKLKLSEMEVREALNKIGARIDRNNAHTDNWEKK